MCGIAGIIRLDGGQVEQSALDRMTDAIAHRGPDGRGTFVEGSVGLGHRRLSVIDLSDAASQPMHSADGKFVLIFNGEIYNFREKRDMLVARGYHFRSSGDSEVLLALYAEFGSSCVDHLRGMFAFTIFDREKQKVFIARDRLGKKPIKYVQIGSLFAFASELKALQTLPACSRTYDEQSVYDYLTMMYVAAPETGLKGIKKLPAAHTMTVDLRSGSIHTERYWTLSYTSDRSKSVAAWKEELMPIMEESVRLRMISDVPLGVFLSGGVDSAAITALMAKQSSRPVETFSIGSPEETHNELPDAERIVKMHGTNHHPIVLSPDIVHLLPELVRTYEEPFADPSTIPTYLLARETRKHVTVALNGDGGDENFGGYVRYPILRFSEKWRRMPRLFHALLQHGTGAYAALLRSTFAYRVHRFQSTIRDPWPERYLQYLSFFTEAEKQSLLRPDVASRMRPTAPRFAALTLGAREEGDDLVHSAMRMDHCSYLVDDLLPKVDLGSMAHGLETRSPFLDHVLLEHTSRIPTSLLLREGTRKWLLKQMLKELVPTETLTRPKTGFRLPLDRWFRTDLRSFVTDRLCDPSSPLLQLFSRDAIIGFLVSYHDSQIDFSDHIWALLWLDEWMRQYTS
ncbi:MAG: asparagine synthase (glutamine-hydrolyzing) [Candidatus Peribacteraceae bacterium]